MQPAKTFILKTAKIVKQIKPSIVPVPLVKSEPNMIIQEHHLGDLEDNAEFLHEHSDVIDDSEVFEDPDVEEEDLLGEPFFQNGIKYEEQEYVDAVTLEDNVNEVTIEEQEIPVQDHVEEIVIGGDIEFEHSD